MGLPIPKSVGDKILSVLGLVVTITGVVASVFAGAGYTGIATSIGGVGMTAKGMEEFINGDTVQSIEDIVNGILEAKKAVPAAEAEVKAQPDQVAVTAVEAAVAVDKAVIG